MLKFCDDSECEIRNNFGIFRLGKTDRKIGDQPNIQFAIAQKKSASRQSPFFLKATVGQSPPAT
jgi:hypothetical protein